MKKELGVLKVKVYLNQMVNDKKEVLEWLTYEVDYEEIGDTIQLAPKDKGEKKLLTSYLKHKNIYVKE